MNKNIREYEPPKTIIYRFDHNDRILTESGLPVPTPDPTAEYAAAALNDFFGGTNTTFEDIQ